MGAEGDQLWEQLGPQWGRVAVPLPQGSQSRYTAGRQTPFSKGLLWSPHGSRPGAHVLAALWHCGKMARMFMQRPAGPGGAAPEGRKERSGGGLAIPQVSGCRPVSPWALSSTHMLLPLWHHLPGGSRPSPALLPLAPGP